MPMIVGIENGTKKGFTKEELGITNSFTMGVLSMVTGVSGYWGKPLNWRTKETMTVEKAHARFCMACHVDPETWKELEPYVTDIEFVQRMADADWHTNCGGFTDEEFREKMADQMLQNAQRAIGDERVHLNWDLRRNFTGNFVREQENHDRLCMVLMSAHELLDTVTDEDYSREFIAEEVLALIHRIVDGFDLHGATVAYDEEDNALCYMSTDDGYDLVLKRVADIEEEE